MAVADIVNSILNVVLDWLYFAISILIIYKIFKIISSMGSGDWFNGWGSGSSGSGGGRGGSGGGGTTGEENYDKGDTHPEPSDAEGKPGTAKGPLDWENPGTIQVEVKTTDGTPVEGAEVVIQPANVERKWYGKREAGSKKYKGPTNRDGFYPDEPMTIGSGMVLVSVNEPGFISLDIRGVTKRDGKNYSSKDQWFVRPGEHTHVSVQLVGKDEAVKGFEPVVRDVYKEDDKLVLEGVIR